MGSYDETYDPTCTIRILIDAAQDLRKILHKILNSMYMYMTIMYMKSKKEYQDLGFVLTFLQSGLLGCHFQAEETDGLRKVLCHEIL